MNKDSLVAAKAPDSLSEPVQNPEVIDLATAPEPALAKPTITHFSIWQQVEQWSNKLDDPLKAEFVKFIEMYKQL